MSERFIYFDIGETLLDSSGAFENATSKFNLAEGNIGDVFEENHDPITQGFVSPKEFWEKCIQKFGLKNAENYNFLDSWVSDYKPIPETHELVARIAPKYRVGILSNIYKCMLTRLLEKNMITNVNYEQIIFSCDVGMMKPHQDIYLLAQERAGVDPKDILLVDDREDSIKGASDVGWNTFRFNTKERQNSVKELEEYLKNY
jgi:putative hydrolase of the HAD superfamily